MPDLAKKMYQGQPGTGDTLLYTHGGAPSSGAILRSIQIANTTATAATFRLAINAGGTLAVGTALFWDVSVPGNTSASFSCFHVLDQGGTIRASQGTSGALTLTISGIEL